MPAKDDSPRGRTPLLQNVKWFWFTRGAGLVVFLFEVGFDKSSTDRATIILAACGLMGLDKVARTDSGK